MVGWWVVSALRNHLMNYFWFSTAVASCTCAWMSWHPASGSLLDEYRTVGSWGLSSCYWCLPYYANIWLVKGGKVDLALTGPQAFEDYPRWWHSSAWNSDADFYQIVITRWIWYSTPGGMELLLNYATSVGPVPYDTRHMICSNNNIPVHDTLFFSFLFLSSPIHRLTLSLNPRWIVAGQESR